jgi:hypothetical protein
MTHDIISVGKNRHSERKDFLPNFLYVASVVLCIIIKVLQCRCIHKWISWGDLVYKPFENNVQRVSIQGTLQYLRLSLELFQRLAQMLSGFFLVAHAQILELKQQVL